MVTEEAAVLIVEDNPDIAEMIGDFLESQGYVVDFAADGVSGLHLAVTQDFDALILDLMLPGIDGLDVCRKLRREAGRDTPILMLTARDTVDDKIAGLDAGADDYLVKPFELRELEARLRALIRRFSGRLVRETLELADLSVDTGTLQVRRGDGVLDLTPITFQLLLTLLQAAPNVVTRRELERAVWGDITPDSDALRSHLYNLRKIIDKPFDRKLLHTVPGRGYRLADPDDG
ncbi:MAG: response regulator transcription factor [Pseudomonadota bacterium]